MGENEDRLDIVVLDENFPGFPVNHFGIVPRYERYIDRVLIPNGMIQDRIEKMAFDIIEKFEADSARSIHLLCVLKGGFKFMADLINKLESTLRARGTTLPLSVDFVRVKSYVNDKSGHDPVLTGVEDPKQYKDKDLLVVEDIIDTGITMRFLLKYLETLSPRTVRVASLLVKRTSRSNGYKPDFGGFEIVDRFVVGYAFDYNENFRDMHHICLINRDGQEKFSVPFSP